MIIEVAAVDYSNRQGWTRKAGSPCGVASSPTKCGDTILGYTVGWDLDNGRKVPQSPPCKGTVGTFSRAARYIQHANRVGLEMT